MKENIVDERESMEDLPPAYSGLEKSYGDENRTSGSDLSGECGANLHLGESNSKISTSSDDSSNFGEESHKRDDKNFDAFRSDETGNDKSTDGGNTRENQEHGGENPIRCVGKIGENSLGTIREAERTEFKTLSYYLISIFKKLYTPTVVAVLPLLIIGSMIRTRILVGIWLSLIIGKLAYPMRVEIWGWFVIFLIILRDQFAPSFHRT